MNAILTYIQIAEAIASTVYGLLKDLVAAHSTNDQTQIDAIRAKLDAAADALGAAGPGG